MRPRSTAVSVLLGCALAASPSCLLASADRDFADGILKVHNAARAEAGAPALAWSESLAEEARVWAEHMADEGALVHSNQQQRNGNGESVWMGPAGRFSVEVILGTFMAEKPNFQPGVFPDISTTGRWRDVGHYSQVIWPTTTAVGCALVQRNGQDYFACRYSPGGNYYGEKVG